MQVLHALQVEVDEALCACEKAFPVAAMVVMFHLLRHLPAQIEHQNQEIRQEHHACDQHYARAYPLELWECV